MTVVEIKTFRRAVLLNALPLNAIPPSVHYFDIACKRATIDAVADIIKQSTRVENYIRHESTVKLLSSLLNIDLKPSSELYEYRNGDVLAIITLKKPIRGQEVEVREDDLEYFVCTVATILYSTTD
jgi:hypothetical protein